MAPTKPQHQPTQTTNALDRVHAARISKTWPLLSHGGPLTTRNSRPKGMHNPGVLCYRRAVLQCLLHVPEVCRYLLSARRCRCREKRCVVCALRRLAEVYWSVRETDRVQRVLEGVDEAVDSFVGDEVFGEYDFMRRGVQADAMEFLEGLVYMMRAREVEVAGRGRSISRLFTVTVRKTWTCEDCGRTSARRAKDLAIRVSLPMELEGKPLDSYLRACFQDEELPDLRCGSDACVVDNPIGRTRTRRLRIVHGPELLVIQLLRFDFDLDTLEVVKDQRRVPHPERLDLSEWTVDNASLKYQLHGVVAHRGDSTSSGHYIAALRCQNGSDVAVANDMGIGISSDRKWLLEPRDDDEHEFDSYLLVYQKVGGVMRVVD